MSFLYNDNTKGNRPYFTDSNITRLITTSSTTFSGIVDIATYLQNVGSASAASQIAFDVKSYIESVSPDAIVPQETNAFDASPDISDVNMHITNNPSAYTDYSSLLQRITQTYNGVKSADSDHEKMKFFITETMQDIVMWKFNAARIQLGETYYANRANPSFGQLYESVMYLYGTRNISPLLTSLDNACVKAIKNIFTPNNSLIPTTTDIFTNITYGGFSVKLYFKLRLLMTEYIDVSSIFRTTNMEDVKYFKKVVVDMFIKACYPYVHILFLKGFCESYIERGDFVNARLTLLAMVCYLFNTLDIIQSSAPPSITLGYQGQLNSIFTMLSNYINKSNKVNVGSNRSAEEEVADIVKELHTLSDDVTSKNVYIQKLKKAIKENQLIMRNILFNIEVKRKEFKWAMREFLIVLVLIVIFVIINIVLIVFKMEDMVYYTSAFISIAAVLYLVAQIIMNMLKRK